jgi:hypothetical protein
MGAFITALIGGGTSLLTYFLSSNENQNLKAEAKQQSALERKDTLAQNAITNDMNQQQIDMNKDKFNYQKGLDMTQDVEKRQGDIFNNAIGLMNNNVTLKNRMLQLWGA